jgi:hypothetical protein
MKRGYHHAIPEERIIGFEEAHERLAMAVRQGLPYAMGKLGGCETRSLFYASGLFQPDWPYSMSWLKYAKQLYLQAGVFPVEKRFFHEFARHYREILPQIDYLYLWQNWGKESSLAKRYATKASFSIGFFQDFIRGSWLESLEGKRVLVVSPFAATIRSQYGKRSEIWKTMPGLLPEFELLTLKCPLHAHLVPPQHSSWMAALEHLCSESDTLDYDVLIAGAGAWGLPLAAHAKIRGKIGVHMGGATQLLFGIKGGRWDDRSAASEIYNEHWTYPSEEETPKGVELIEGACYWKP